MRTIKLLITLAILFTGFSGCVNDRGNYDYDTIPVFLTDGWQVKVNDKSIDIANDLKIVVKTGDLLHIAMNRDFMGEARPDYHWKIFPKNQPDNPEHIFENAREIANTKDFNQNFNEGPGSYILYFEAINSDNGTKFYVQFEIEVLSIKGMLVYHTDADGKGDYGAFSTPELFPELSADNLGRTDHIYSTVNNGAKIEKPTQIWVRKAMKGRETARRILLASENTVTVVNYETHEKESDTYSSLFFIPSEKAPKPEGHMNGFQKEFLIQNGELCVIDYMQVDKAVFGVHFGLFGCEYSPYMMSVPMDMSTYAGGWNIAFNKTNRCFEREDWSYMSGLISGGGAVDISNTGMDLLYMDKGPGYSIHAVMREDNGKLHYVCFDFPSPDMDYYTAFCSADHDLSAHATINEKSLWAVNARGSNSFFTSGNEVHLLNHQSGAVTPANLELPTNAEITALQVLKDDENIVYDNALLFVAYNLNGTGVVRQYRFNPLSGVINKSSKQEFGKYGQILGIALKK